MADSPFAGANTSGGGRFGGGSSPSTTPGSGTGSGNTGNPFLDGFTPEADKLPPLIGGMDDGYGATVQVTAGGSFPMPATSNAIYRAGDEFNLLGNMSEAQRQRVQQALISAGLADADSITFGALDPATIRGFEAALGYANMNGKSWQDILFTSSGQRLLGRGSGGGGGAKRAPLTTQVTDTDALRRLFKKTMVEMAGSRVEGFDVDAAVSAYQQAQRSAQQQAYGMAETGGEVMAPPSADDFIAGQLEEKAGTQVQANSAAERAGQLLQMIKSGF